MTVAQGSLLRVSSSNYSNLGESRVERNYQIFGEPIKAGIQGGELPTLLMARERGSPQAEDAARICMHVLAQEEWRPIYPAPERSVAFEM